MVVTSEALDNNNKMADGDHLENWEQVQWTRK